MKIGVDIAPGPDRSVTSYVCLECGWIGTQPSITDTSEVAVNRHGEPIGGTIHVPVCPNCFGKVKKDAQSSVG